MSKTHVREGLKYLVSKSNFSIHVIEGLEAYLKNDSYINKICLNLKNMVLLVEHPL